MYKRQAQLSGSYAASVPMGGSVSSSRSPKSSLMLLNASWKPQALVLFLSLVDQPEPQEGSFLLF